MNGGQGGFATHYWDCCKPSCAWPDKPGSGPIESCDQNNNSFGGDYNQQSNCSGGGAFQCWGFHPRALNSRYAIGWAAFNSGQCGECYQLDFSGQSSSGYNDPGAASLAGKVMIVQVINTGGIAGNQFDLLVPGGGVGDFNACSTQWGGTDLGDQYGGWFTQCRNQNAGNNQGAVDCVKNKCNSNFSGKSDLLEGCLFWAEWAKVADNPSFNFAKVNCPSEITSVSKR
ncbi:MAG: hypothetical protein JXX14_02680 [Deltaproteobacteria bacterium]|nr:hypothetical protein [Deltaproteobacteria bacterium]